MALLDVQIMHNWISKAIEGDRKYVAALLLALPVLPRLLAFFRLPPPPKKAAIPPSLEAAPVDSRARTIYPEDVFEHGGYAPSPYGKTRYWLLGPEDGVKVVMIHGVSIPSIVWKDVAPTLASKGFRLLIYDLYGRGYSEGPQEQYRTELHTTQIALLMQYVRWEKAHIIGFSVGGAIAAAFVASFPFLCSGNVALISSAGMMTPDDLPKGTGLITSPLAQSIASTSFCRSYLQRKYSKLATPPTIDDLVSLQIAYHPGFHRAMSSVLREGPIRGEASSFVNLAAPEYTVLMINGTDDERIPYRTATRMQSLMPNNSRMITIDGGHHFLPLSHPEVVRDALLDFFQSTLSARHRS